MGFTNLSYKRSTIILCDQFPTITGFLLQSTASQQIAELDKKPAVTVKTEADSASGPTPLHAPGLKMDQYSKKETLKPWTDQETLLLLEVRENLRSPFISTSIKI